MEEKKQRGGARPGAGRKKGKTMLPISFRIEENILQKLKDVGNKNRFVNIAIQEKLEQMETFTKEGDEVE